MKTKNFHLININRGPVTHYLINSHEGDLHFLQYKKGTLTPICSIGDIKTKLLYFIGDEKDGDIKFSSIPYPDVIARKPNGKPLPIHMKNDLEVTTENGNMFIVRNEKYPDLPVANATIFFKKSTDKELRLLALVYIEVTGELKIDFI